MIAIPILILILFFSFGFDIDFDSDFDCAFGFDLNPGSFFTPPFQRVFLRAAGPLRDRSAVFFVAPQARSGRSRRFKNMIP